MARRRTETKGPIWPPGPDVGLTDFHVALLILCASSDDGVSAYDIELLIESGRGGVLGRSAAHVYKEIKILAARGYLEVEPSVGRSRRRIYHITEEGREAARVWVERAPPDLPPTDDSVAYILINAARFVPHATVWKALLRLWYEVEERLAELDGVERQIRRDRPLTQQERLEHSLTRGLLGAYAAWLSEVGREWGMTDPQAE
jgi:DNA-binding PadR family transcriptional regulator